MGMYDSVNVECPNCKMLLEFQSKSGDCLLNVFSLETCPNNVLENVNRHSPRTCLNCKSKVTVEFKLNEYRRAVIVE